MNSCKHISNEDLNRYFSLDSSKIDKKNIAFYREFIYKAMHCPECRTRYRIAIDSRALVDAYKIDENKLYKLSISEVIETKLNGFDKKVALKMQSWLSSSKEFLSAFDSVLFSDAKLAFATRGLFDDVPQRKITLSEDEGSCNFETEEKTELIFELSRITEDGEPICLIIKGREDTEFEEVYPLEGYEEDGYVSDTLETNAINPIVLEKGKYTLYVPVIKK